MDKELHEKIREELQDMVMYSDKHADMLDIEEMEIVVAERIDNGLSFSKALTDTLADYGYIPF